VTAHIGKWHLGKEDSGPLAQGFDVAIGGEEEAAPPSWFDPFGLPRLADRAPGEYLTDRLTVEAEEFLVRNAERPFFLVLSHFAVHTPIAAPAPRVEAWKHRLAGAAAETDARALRSLGAEYAAMIESVDRSVGRILDQLSNLGLARDTVVVLTSDNGGLLETPETGQLVTSNAPLRGGKATLYEGGLRVPLVVRWPAVVAAGRETDAVAATVDWFPTLLEAADRARRAPREPARDEATPRGMPERPRGADRGRGTDLPSLAAAELDGRSLLPILEGRASREERTLHFLYPHYIAGYRHDPGRETYWNTPGAAILAGATKLIRRFDGPVELYDVADDPGETRDLSPERPEEVARLAARLDEWLAQEGAHLPAANPAYDPAAFERRIAAALASLGRSTDWTPNGGCATAVREGRLAIDCEGHPFIVGPEMVVRGPLRVEVRCRASGTAGAGAVWYRGPEKPAFQGDRIALPPCGPELATREARVAPAGGGTISQLRLDFSRPRSGGHVEIDWIRLYAGDGTGTPIVEWSFDR
jgi:arylsulfatase A-like enzyme